MARRKSKSRPYKLVNAFSKDIGNTGDQFHIGKISKLDAQGITAYVRNCVISVISQSREGLGYMLYATTSSSWSDDYIITARAINNGGTTSLSIHRGIKEDSEVVDANYGVVHLWIESTDPGASDEDVRLVVESWGRFIEFTEDSS